jgi:hypothetical protein
LQKSDILSGVASAAFTLWRTVLALQGRADIACRLAWRRISAMMGSTLLEHSLLTELNAPDDNAPTPRGGKLFSELLREYLKDRQGEPPIEPGDEPT